MVGVVVSKVDVLVYMLVFIFLIFIMLGCVKCLIELILVINDECLFGCGYGWLDWFDLLNVLIFGMVGVLLILFLYLFLV